jgi:HTH-type transcriptional regulator, sugar sensing transcriptional regulator
MMTQKELVNKLKDYFDLNVYETKVWLALLSKGIATAGEVADISGVPRSRAYDVLESLEKKGFALVKLGKPVKYIGVKPAVVVEKLKNNVKKEAEERIVTFSTIGQSKEFSQLEELYKTGLNPVTREELSSALKGKLNISSQIRESLQNAKKEVVICTTVSEIASKFKLFSQTFGNLQKSNIKIKIALSGDDKIISDLSKKLNLKIKKVQLDAKFFIIDRTEILFYVSKGADEDIAIWLNSPFFAEAFAVLFDKTLEK